jgi:hypothetical protein
MRFSAIEAVEGLVEGVVSDEGFVDVWAEQESVSAGSSEGVAPEGFFADFMYFGDINFCNEDSLFVGGCGDDFLAVGVKCA